MLMTVARTAAAPGLPTIFPFSLAGAAHDVCFISGMPAVDGDGAYVPAPFSDELDRAWRHVASIADAAGFAAADIVYVQCVLADIGDYAAFNDWWRLQFPDAAAAPARFTFQAGALPFGAKVELQAVAGR
jgi:2-iminobutanoate/2-iminopropanoate deaminase